MTMAIHGLFGQVQDDLIIEHPFSIVDSSLGAHGFWLRLACQ